MPILFSQMRILCILLIPPLILSCKRFNWMIYFSRRLISKRIIFERFYEKINQSSYIWQQLWWKCIIKYKISNICSIAYCFLYMLESFIGLSWIGKKAGPVGRYKNGRHKLKSLTSARSVAELVFRFSRLHNSSLIVPSYWNFDSQQRLNKWNGC